MQRVRHRWRWGFTLLWMSLIYFMSAQTGSGEQSAWVLQNLLALLGLSVPSDAVLGALHLLLRKGAHVTEYALLALLMAWSLMPRAGYLWLAWVYTVAYAMSDEVHQLFVPRRAGSLLDVAVDALGASLALWLFGWRLQSAQREAR